MHVKGDIPGGTTGTIMHRGRAIDPSCWRTSRGTSHAKQGRIYTFCSAVKQISHFTWSYFPWLNISFSCPEVRPCLLAFLQQRHSGRSRALLCRYNDCVYVDTSRFRFLISVPFCSRTGKLSNCLGPPKKQQISLVHMATSLWQPLKVFKGQTRQWHIWNPSKTGPHSTFVCVIYIIPHDKENFLS